MNPIVEFRCGLCKRGGPIIGGIFNVEGFPVLAWSRKHSVQKWGVAESAMISNEWCFPLEILPGAPPRQFGAVRLAGNGGLPYDDEWEHYQVACRRHGRFPVHRLYLVHVWEEARNGGNRTVILSEGRGVH